MTTLNYRNYEQNSWGILKLYNFLKKKICAKTGQSDNKKF